VKRAVRAFSLCCFLGFAASCATNTELQAAVAQSTTSPALQQTAQSGNEPAEICMAPASVQMAAGKSDDAVVAVREAFVTFLNGPSLKVTPLTSRLPSQAREEARQGHCRYVLFVTLTHKKKNSGGGVFARAAGDAASSAAWHIPGGSSAGSAAARSAATSVASGALRGVNSNV
jgi:hypothetical protein